MFTFINIMGCNAGRGANSTRTQPWSKSGTKVPFLGLPRTVIAQGIEATAGMAVLLRPGQASVASIAISRTGQSAVQHGNRDDLQTLKHKRSQNQTKDMPFDLITGKFVPEKSNIWRDCCDGQYDWVKEHILEGCTLNEADHCGDPPMVLAAGGGHLSCVKLLLEEGADIEQRNVMRETPLIRAAHNGHLSVVEFLLQSGADITARDLGDNTALHWAAMRGHVEVVRTLLAGGADREARNKQGVVPVDLCQPTWSLSWRFTQAVLAGN